MVLLLKMYTWCINVESIYLYRTHMAGWRVDAEMCMTKPILLHLDMQLISAPTSGLPEDVFTAGAVACFAVHIILYACSSNGSGKKYVGLAGTRAVGQCRRASTHNSTNACAHAVPASPGRLTLCECFSVVWELCDRREAVDKGFSRLGCEF